MLHAYDLRFAGIHVRILSPRSIHLPENLSSFLNPSYASREPDRTVEVIFGTEQVTYRDSDSVKVFPRSDGDNIWRIVPSDRNHTCRLFIPRSLEEKFCVNANWTLFLMVDKLLLPLNRVILHASAVIHNGEAILFTAPSGTGKSTQAALWEEHLGAEIINGDKVIVSADRDRPVAYGGPIAGTSRIFRDIAAPIRAIVYLRQGKTNHAELLGQRHAFMNLYSQVIKRADDPAFNQALLPLLGEIAERVPMLEFSCLPDTSAVEYLLEQLDSLPTHEEGKS
jgi:hypothetical protein